MKGKSFSLQIDILYHSGIIWTCKKTGDVKLLFYVAFELLVKEKERV